MVILYISIVHIWHIGPSKSMRRWWSIMWYHTSDLCQIVFHHSLCSKGMSHPHPQNPQSKFRALQHEHLAATRAKPRPDLQSQKWICSSSKPCAKRMNVTQKRSVLPLLLCRHFSIHTETCCSFQQHHIACTLLFALGLIGPLILFAGKECLPEQFLSLPGLAGCFKRCRFSSGRWWPSRHLLCCHALHLLLPSLFASFSLLPLNMWVSGRCRLFSLLYFRMCAQPVCVRALNCCGRWW